MDGMFPEARYPIMGMGHQIYMIVLEGLKTVKRVVRIAWFVCLACGGVFVLGHFLRQINIVVNPLVWPSAQIISALLSFTFSPNLFVRSHGTGNRVSVLLGLAFAVSGL